MKLGLQKALDFSTLMFSASTLVCCALPATLVAIGAGSTMAALATNFPALIWLSTKKVELFIFAGAMLLLVGLLQYRSKSLPCPLDAKKAEDCARAKSISRVVFFFSVLFYGIGGFFAFIAPKFI